MKKISIYTALSIAAIAIATTAFTIKPLKHTVDSVPGFAVVELFTSEGCSSCPAADEVAAKIEQEHNGQVYILAYHVDYWNRLGWTDVFSKPEYSERQRQYAGKIPGSQVYTPQAVVNGSREFVGSKEGTLRNTIKASLAQQHSIQLSINHLQTSKGGASFGYSTNSDIRGLELTFALVQKTGVTKVKNGENSGRTLKHVQIVRDMQTLPLTKQTGTATITLPPNFDPANFELIGLIQNSGTGSITAATRQGFSSVEKTR